MVKYAKQVAISEKKLQVEERNILSVAYKNVVGMKRNSRRLLTGAEDKEIKKDKEKGKYFWKMISPIGRIRQPH